MYWAIGALAAFFGLLHVSSAFYDISWGIKVWIIMRLSISMSLQNMTLPLTILAILSFFGGFLGIPGASAISNFLAPVFGEHGHIETLWGRSRRTP